jgi:5-formyltetrahydrofolate cyclo-ligase
MASDSTSLPETTRRIAAKANVRRTLRHLRRELSTERRHAASRTVCAKVLHIWLQLGRPPLAAYAAMPDELSLDPLCHLMWQRNIPVWLPRVAGPGRLTWVPTTRREDLAPGTHGIREPTGEGRRLPASTLVLVPGVGFTAEGPRLGQGGGFYDRLIHERAILHDRGLNIGVAYREQIIQELPVEVHDAEMDRVVVG